MSAKWIARTPPKRQVEGSNPSGPDFYVKNDSNPSGSIYFFNQKKKIVILIQTELDNPILLDHTIESAYQMGPSRYDSIRHTF